MNRLLKKLPSPVQYILLVYGTGMLIFSFFRLLLLWLHRDELKEIPSSVIFQSLLMGLRFDAVISGYLLVLPAVVFFLLSFFKKDKSVLNVISVFIVVVYTVSFFMHISDIRWFEHGASRLTVSILQWTDTPGWMVKFIFQDIYNYPFLILFITLIVLFYKLIRRIATYSFDESSFRFSGVKGSLVFIVLFALMFTGIRGRLAIKSPIRWGTAFFSPYNFANQLGLNPVYTFMRSLLDQKENREVVYHFMDDKDAEEAVRRNTNILYHNDAISPVSRKIIAQGLPHKYNVVLVLMESMSAKNMTRFGNTGNLTPVLDSLFEHAVSFSDFYSDGNHTFNGIYTSLYGFHSLPMVHPMKDLLHQQPYEGLPGTLESQGYQSVFFTTHDEQFDNMAGFLLPNGFQKIISEKDYEKSYVMSTMGVPDHIMFERAVLELDNMKNKSAPFFSAMITGSNHEPFVYPENISLHAHSKDMKQKMVEYADWSIGKFMSDACHHSWFDSTIFIFTGDHGGLVEGVDRYLAFHHLPLIIYAPKIFSPQVISSVGGQADIYATVCGLLNISYTSNSMGLDLMKTERWYYPFNFDEEMCCISKDYLFAAGHEQERFYKISPDKKNIVEAEKNPAADSMRIFLQAVLQTTQQMIRDHKMK